MDVLPTTELPLAQATDAAKVPEDKAALTPPTSEDMDKRERSSSELSELDLDDEEDIGDVEPDHYWDGGKIPVFKPTMDQFRSFKKFIDKIDKYGMKSGIVKVIPPKEWRDSLPDLTEAVKTIKINRPISQDFSGRQGQYTQQNIEKQRSYNLPQWKALTEELDHQPPAKRGERRGDQTQPTRTRSTRSQASTPAEPGAKRPRGRPRKHRKEEAQEPSDRETTEPRQTSQPQVPPTPTSPPEQASAVDKKVAALKKDAADESSSKPRGRQPKSISSRRKNNRSEAADEIDEEAFKSFDYHLQGVEEFTPERCAELEQNYWKTINFGQPMYGADMPGSLFDETTTSWNVAKLENLLDVLGTKVPGVNTAYLYLGMWKATFAWHLEDVDLYSINYIHFGAPKQWYSISQEDARRFENAMKSIWPNDAKNCSQFLRHKTYLVSPQRLENEFNIKVNKLVHYEGEFVLTYPYGYHSGFNLGYNCAESVNFATEQWMEYGRIAKKCLCEDDSVWVDVAEIERKLRGEPTPEYYEETDEEDEDEEVEEILHDLPSPPASVKGRPKTITKKRKREAGSKELGGTVKRVKLRLKVPHREPCVLCPNDVQYDILLPTDNGQKAHRICALYTPETYIIEDNGEERVCNVANIDKARLDLKCNYCRSKKGACFQCASKKCTRAFHATCAAAAGVQIDEGPVPTFDEDGTEYFCEGFDLRCRFHRPKRAKNTDIDALENKKLILEYAKELKPKQVIQAQYLGGEIFAGMIVENRPSELSAIIDVLPDCAERVEIEWKYLLVLDPSDSLRPKPSANAKPLPEHLNFNSSNLNARNQKDGPPEMDEPFCDPNSGQKWAEFHTATAAEVRNPYQTKVDMSKPERLWHYLGKTSTEARAQFTEDHKKPQHNPKSNFLETVKPPPRPMQTADRRSLAATYPTGANINALNGAMAAQRQSLQPQYASAKPYDYKPKGPYTPSYANSQHAPYRSTAHHSPHRYGSQSSSRSGSVSHPIPPYPYQYGAQSYSSGSRRPSFTSPTYAQPSAASSYHQTHSQSPYASYHDSQTGRPLQYPNYHRPETYASSPYSQRATPAAPSMEAPSTSASPPAQSPSARSESVSSTSSGQPDIEYLQFLQRYPYLRNAYLRRPKMYHSPYPGTSGFSDSYNPRKRSMSHTSSTYEHGSRSYYMGGYGNYGGYGSYGSGHAYGPAYTGSSSSSSHPHPGLTFQSPQEFQADVKKQQQHPPQTNDRFESLLKQLSHANENAARRFAQNQAQQQQAQQAAAPAQPQPHSASPPAPQAATQVSSSLGLGSYTGPSNTRGYKPGYGYDSGAFGPATQTTTVTLDKLDPALAGAAPPTTPGKTSEGAGAAESLTPQRPEVSPLSDIAPDSDVVEKAGQSQAQPPQFGGETWRYS